MSKIDRLIKELCPDGVEFKKIIEFAEVSTGSSNRQDAIEDGLYPFYVRSKDVFRINSYEYDEEAIIIPGEGGIGEIFHYVNGKYALHQRAYRIHITNSKVNAKYLYYYMFNFFKNFIMGKAVNATVTSIRKPMIEQFLTAIPPLEVQEEIVRILDKFGELEAELKAELKARKRQYEFWRGKLLNKEGNVKINDYFERVKGTPITASKMKEISVDGGDVRIFAGGQTRTDTTRDNIPEKDIIDYPCVIVQSRGLIDFIYYDKPFTFKNEMWAYTCKEPITVKYLYYYLKNNVRYFRTVGGQMGSMPQISLPITEKFEVYLPSIEEQTKIVKFLDRFEILINDISDGLPAEIEARRKQYEYYRNKLLSFEELI